jgi:hypothetical protein
MLPYEKQLNSDSNGLIQVRGMTLCLEGHFFLYTKQDLHRRVTITDSRYNIISVFRTYNIISSAMKVPKTHIYFECILPYLQVKDMAKWEASIENHELRAALGFNFLNNPEESFNPYQQLVRISNESSFVSLLSDEMKLWCERRHLNLPKLILSYKAPFHRQAADQSAWNLYHHVKELSVGYSEEFYYEECPRLEVLLFSNIIGNSNALAPSFQRFLSSINHGKNSTLVSFTMVGIHDYFSVDDFDVFIQGTPCMKSLNYRYGQISDKNILTMSIHWKQLTSIEFYKCGKDDLQDPVMNFQPFQVSGHRFHTIHFSSRSRGNLSMNGLSQWLENSSGSLKNLKLELTVTSEEIYGLIVTRFPLLESLSLEIDNNDKFLLTHHLVESIATNLPLLKHIDIFIRRLDLATDVSDASIHALVTGCPMLYTISLQWSQVSVIGNTLTPAIPDNAIPDKRITKASYELIAKKLCKTIRVVKLNLPVVAEVMITELKYIFQDCYQDVYVNDTRIQKYEFGR